MEKIIALRPTPSHRPTPMQEKLWEVLQDEHHRTLPIKAICQMAGYRESRRPGISPCAMRSFVRV